jgi:hypothetical protein
MDFYYNDQNYAREKDTFIEILLEFIPPERVQEFLLRQTKIIDLLSAVPNRYLGTVTRNFILNSHIVIRLQGTIQQEYMSTIFFLLGNDGENISEVLERIYARRNLTLQAAIDRRSEE